MKKFKLLAICIMVLAITPITWAQLRIDIHTGFSPGSDPGIRGILIKRNYPVEEYIFKLAKIRPQWYAGLKGHFTLGTSFFTEFGLTYSWRSSQYAMNYTLQPDQQIRMSESEHLLMFPANIGIRMGSLEILSGFRVNAVLSKSTELSHLKGYDCVVSPVSFGWNTGVRYAIGKLTVGLDYMGSFNRICQATSVNGQSLEIMNIPGQLVLTFQQNIMGQ